MPPRRHRGSACVAASSEEGRVLWPLRLRCPLQLGDHACLTVPGHRDELQQLSIGAECASVPVGRRRHGGAMWPPTRQLHTHVPAPAPRLRLLAQNPPGFQRSSSAAGSRRQRATLIPRGPLKQRPGALQQLFRVASGQDVTVQRAPWRPRLLQSLRRLRRRAGGEGRSPRLRSRLCCSWPREGTARW